MGKMKNKSDNYKRTFFYNPVELRKSNSRPMTADSKKSDSTYALKRINKDFEDYHSDNRSIKSNKSIKSYKSNVSKTPSNLNKSLNKSKSFLLLHDKFRNKFDNDDIQSVINKYKHTPQ